MRRLLILLCSTLPAAEVQFQKQFRGNGDVHLTALASDAQGNVYVAGHTTATDLPVRNAVRPRNTGSAIIVSDDSGRTWSPTGFIPDLPFSGVRPPAIHPRDSKIVVATGTQGIYRSTGAGTSWTTVVDLTQPRERQRIGYVDMLAFDPRQPNTVYVAATRGVLKSLDAGLSWSLLTGGLAPGNCCTGAGIAVDPHSPNRLAYTINQFAYFSHDAGASWRLIQFPERLGRPFVVFDPFQAGVLYAYSYEGVYRSSDLGATWIKLPLSPGLYGATLVLDASTAGRLYAWTTDGISRSDNRGDSWTPVGFPPTKPALGSITALAVDPRNPNRLLAAGLASTGVHAVTLGSNDGGNTWQPLSVVRTIYGFTFDPSQPGRVYASGGGATWDAFVAKLDPQGDIAFLTYLGGQGYEYVNGIAVDSQGNVYVGGLTESPDFEGATTRLHTGIPGIFAASLDPAGRLRYATLLDSSQPYEEVKAVAVDSAGAIHILSQLSIRKLDSTGSRLIFTSSIEGATAMTIDANGDALAGGIFSGRPGLLRVGAAGESLGVSDVELAPIALAGAGETLTIGANAPGVDTNCPHDSGYIGRPQGRAAHMTDVAVIAASGTALLGGSCRDTLTHMTLSANGVLVAGITYSDPFPFPEPLFGPPPLRTAKPFLASIDRKGASLRTYLPFGEVGGIAPAPDGGAYVAYSPPVASTKQRAGVVIKIAETPAAAFAALRVTDAFQRTNLPITAREIVVVEAPELVPDQEIHLGFSPASPLPVELGGVSVRFDGMPAQIVAVSRGEVTCIVPDPIRGRALVAVQVKHRDRFSNALYAEVVEASLVLYPFAWNGDGTFNSIDNPAPPGSTVSLFFTGTPDGAVSPFATLAFDATPIQMPLQPLAPIPGFIPGLYEVRVQIPPGLGGVTTARVYSSDAPALLSPSPGVRIHVAAR